MSGKTISNSATKIEALQLQSSAYGVVIPLLLGRTRIAGNLLDYLGFQAIPHTETQGGKGGAVKVQSTTYTYQADVIMGLCHGPIAEVSRIWRGKKLYEGGYSSADLASDLETWTVPASGSMAHTVAHAANYLLSYGLTPIGPPIALGTDYTVAGGTYTILNEALRGVSVTAHYAYTTTPRPQTAMDQLGLTFGAGTIGQAAWTPLLGTGHEVPYSGLAWVAGQAYDLGTGAQVDNHLFEVIGPLAYHLGAAVPDVDPALALQTILTQAQAGAGFPAALLGDWSAWSDYCVAAGLLISPALVEQSAAADVVSQAARLTNTAPVWSDGVLKMVPLADTGESGNGRTFTPDITPVYDLDDTCYSPTSAGDPPIKVAVKSSAERFNHWRVEFLNRAHEYAVEIAEAKDQADIEAHGLRTAATVQAHWICDGDTARHVAQILLQRSLYVCAEYRVPLPWHFALIEPADLLTLSDPGLAMVDVPVRVTIIEESEDGDLAITAEDYPAGVAGAARYPHQGGSGYSANYNADPGDVDPPLIFEAPAALTSTGLEVYVAVRGSAAAWGGCQVWLSLDGSNYKQMGVVYGPARYGTLSAAATAGAASLAVHGLGAAQMLSGSAADAAALATLCYVGGAAPEYLAYQGATLTGAGAYTLTGLVHAAYSTAAADHASGAPFARVDDRIARSGALDLTMIGQTLHFKFTSFNTVGGGQQGLADVSAYTYTIVGDMAAAAPPATAVATLTATPETIQLAVDGATGLVTDFSHAISTLAVIVGGIDQIADWAISKVDTGVISNLSGAHDQTLTITGYDPSKASAAYPLAVLQTHLNGDGTDTSKYKHVGTIGTAVSWVADATSVNGTVMRVSKAGLINDSRISYGPAPELRAVGSWTMRLRMKARTLPVDTNDQWYLPGNAYRGLRLNKGAGGGYFIALDWFTQTGDKGIQTPEMSLTAGQWYLVEASYDESAGVLRIFRDGALVHSVTRGSGLRDLDDPATLLCLVGCRYTMAGWDTRAGNMDYAEFQFFVGEALHTAAYTDDGLPFADGSYLSLGFVDVTATSGTVSITKRVQVAAVPGGPPAITATLSQTSWTANASPTGAVASFAGSSTTMKVFVGGIDDTANWTFSYATNNAAIGASLAGNVLSITAFGSTVDAGYVDITANRAGYTPQTVRYPLAKIKAADVLEIRVNPPTIFVHGYTVSGHVPSYTGASAAITVVRNGVDETGSWTLAINDGAHWDATRSGATITLTALDDATDTDLITATLTHATQPAIVRTIPVAKLRDLIEGTIGSIGSQVSSNPTVGATSASLTLAADGKTSFNNGTTSFALANWYSPTTSAVGAGYWVRVTEVMANGAVTYSGPALGTWVALSSARTLTGTHVSGDGYWAGQIEIATSSAGAGAVTIGAVTFNWFVPP